MHYYQRRDQEIVDYQLIDVPGFDLPMRGPDFPGGSGRRSIAFLGAAQTFGTFVDEPFPTLVGRELGVRWYNLGLGGAGPEAYAPHLPIFSTVNAADIVVVQVMSGRSASNSRLTCRDGSSTLVDNKTGEAEQADVAFQRIIDTEGFAYAKRLLDESKANWANSMIELLDSITAPTVLLWFSQRDENLSVPNDGSAWDLLGPFPQGIDSETIETVAPYADRYVRCVSTAGMPQTLRSRFTGEPVSPNYPDDLPRSHPTQNTYYPSPEMHHEAFELLTPVCQELLDDLDRRPPERNHYQARDQHITDYQVADVPGFRHQVRGPDFPSGTGDKKIAFLGSAHTFGVFAEKPFPTLIGESLGCRWMNMGIGGAGPSVFGPNSAYLEAANAADLIVLQLMSGRSVSNSRFESRRGFSTLHDRHTGESVNAYAAYTQLLETTGDTAMIEGLVNESRWQWVKELTDVLEAAGPPVVLLWLSERSIDQPLSIDPEESWQLMDGFPHFIDRPSIRAVLPFADELVEVVSSEGLPQQLVDATTGLPAEPDYPTGTGPKDKSINSYYPSPEMHVLAAEALLPVCKRLLGLPAERS